MNKTILDALVIDHALGALSGDTAALLEAYLSRNPDEAGELEQTAETVGLLKDLLKQDSIPLPDYRAPVLVQRRRWTRCSLQAAGMAATLAIGLFLGRSQVDKSVSAAPAPVLAAAETAAPSKRESGFWSVSPDHRMKRVVRSSNWKWNSPVQQPEYMSEGDTL